jgi:Transposase DDE domain
MDDTLVFLFCLVDDYCREFYPKWEKTLIEQKIKKRRRPSCIAPSEIMTIFIYFHMLRFRDFKTYYTRYVMVHMRNYFPSLPSYSHMVNLLKSVLVPLCVFVQSLTVQRTGIYFIDSMIIKVCHIKREKQHRVFNGLAKKGKSSIGWFFGFKLHLVINDKGELMAFKLTAGNVDDRKPVPDLVKNLIGKLFGDKGYISKELFEKLFQEGLQLVTRLKSNMKNKLMPVIDKILLRKRSLIETVNDQLKNISQIEHTRHRSVWNFMVNILGALAAYALQPKKPSLNLTVNGEQLMQALVS